MERMDKINQLFKREISAMILLGEIKDPRVRFVTITYADVSKDLSWAHIGYSVLSDNPDDIRSVQQGLNSASSTVRRLMGERITLRHIPQVKFVYDDRVSKSVHMSKVFDDLQKERAARGVEPAQPQPDSDE